MIDYAIRRIHLFPAFKFGCLTGGILMLLPGLLLGAVVRALVGILRRWLDAWQALSLDIGGRNLVDVDLLSLVKLAGFLRELRVLDEQGWVLALAVVLGTAIAGGLLVGLLALFGAAIYNVLAALSGGLVVGADALEGWSAPAVPAAAPPQGKGRTLPLHLRPRPGPAPPPVQPAPAAWLASGQNPAQQWPLKTGVTCLGSAPGNDITLPGLAARHAEIRLENGRYVLHALESGSTAVNNRPIVGPNMLKEGFRVRLGNYELIFHQA
jgi:hypothetical protein